MAGSPPSASAPVELQSGWLPGTRRVDSPNFDARPGDEAPSLLVLHAISLPPGEYGGAAIEQLFTNRLDPQAHPYYAGLRDLRVSAHFLVRRDGELVQFVATDRRAWHAGVSSWRGRARCNDFSVGVELEGTDTEAFTPEQYERLAGLVVALRRTLPLRDVAAHSEIAPGRKTDPGPHFDWRRLLARLARTA